MFSLESYIEKPTRVEVRVEIINAEESLFRDLMFFSAHSQNMENTTAVLELMRSDSLWISTVQNWKNQRWTGLLQREWALSQRLFSWRWKIGFWILGIGSDIYTYRWELRNIITSSKNDENASIGQLKWHSRYLHLSKQVLYQSFPDPSRARICAYVLLLPRFCSCALALPKICSCALTQLQKFVHVAYFPACALVLIKYKAN